MTDQLNSIAKTVKLDTLDGYPQLKLLEEKTGVKASVFALAISVFLLICLIGSQSAVGFVLGIGCFLIPGYFSFIALESPEIEDDTKYLTYWIVFALFEILSPILGLFMAPFFYGICRLVLTVLFLHPKINLSGTIYHKVIQPNLSKHQTLIDKKFSEAQNYTREQAKKMANEISERLKKND